MENNYTDQEKQLRALSEDFTVEIDTSEMWDRVERQLPREEKERRPVVWWFVGGMMMILAGIIMINVVQGSKKEEFVDQPAEEHIKIAEVLAENQNEAVHEKSFAVQSAAKPQILTENNKQPTQILDSNNKKNEITSPNDQIATAIEEQNSAIFNSDRYDEESTMDEAEIDHVVREIIPSATMIDPSSDAEVEPLAERIEALRSTESHPLLDGLAPEFLVYDRAIGMPHKKVQVLKEKTWLPYYGLYSGVSTHSSKITTNITEGMELARFEDEQALFGLSSDLWFGMENTGGWRIGLGLGYSRLVSRYSQLVPDTTETVVQGNVTSKIDEEGNITHEYGDLKQIIITDYKVRWHRLHDQVNLQLNIGKQLARSGRFKVFADANLSRNIWSRHSGYFFKEGESRIQKFEAGGEHPYDNAGFAMGLDLEFAYTLNQFSISLRSFGQMGLGHMTQQTNYYQIKNSQYGVQLGIVYRP